MRNILEMERTGLVVRVGQKGRAREREKKRQLDLLIICHSNKAVLVN